LRKKTPQSFSLRPLERREVEKPPSGVSKKKKKKRSRTQAPYGSKFFSQSKIESQRVSEPDHSPGRKKGFGRKMPSVKKKQPAEKRGKKGQKTLKLPHFPPSKVYRQHRKKV